MFNFISDKIDMLKKMIFLYQYKRHIKKRIEKNNFGYSKDINGNTVARFTVERKDYEIPAS